MKRLLTPKRYSIVLGLVVLVLMLLVTLSANAAQYSVTALNGVIGNPAGINDSGQIISYSSFYSSYYLWTSGVSENLGTMATSINNLGQVTGYDRYDNISNPWVEGNWLGDLPINEGEAWGINESSQVVGVMYVDSIYSYHAFKYDNGTLTDLTPTWNDASIGMAINDSGQIIINQSDYSGYSYLLDNGELTNTGLYNARAINNSGGILGWKDSIPALWCNNVTTFLCNSSIAGNVRWLSGINNSDQVVGNLATNSAFLWENGVMTDLNQLLYASSGWSITEVGGINNNGQIVGIGRQNGQYSAVLLTPVPEPSALAGLLFGVICCFSKRRK